MIDFSKNEVFLKTSVGKELSSRPVGFLDIGARGGVHELIYPLGRLANIIAFEPDPDADTAIPGITEYPVSPGANLVVERIGLGAENKEELLYLTDNPAASSIFPPVEQTVNRYHMAPPKPSGKTTAIEVKRLDDVLNTGYQHNPYAAEILKLDTQGYELEVLKGGEQTLRESSIALFIEVEFMQIYERQPLFSDVENYLRDLGFSFYGFDSLHYRSTKRVNNNLAPKSRERLYWADAVFFKDPLSPSWKSDFSERQWNVLFVSAVIFGYIDFALEITEQLNLPNAEIQQLKKVAMDFGSQTQDAMVNSVNKLAKKVSENPGLANQLVGEWIASQHPYADFQYPENKKG